MLLRLHDLLRHSRDSRQHFGRDPIDEPKGHHEAPVVQQSEIVDLLVEQLGVRHHDLLAGEGANPGRLEADILDIAVDLAEADAVAPAEGLVEDDRKGGEQVGEDALGCKADGDAADAEARDQAGDVDAQIGEDEYDRDRKQGDRDQHPYDPDRGAQPAMLVVHAGAVLDEAEDQLPAPDRRLEGGGDHEQDVDDAHQPGRGRGVLGDQFGRGHDDEEDSGLGQRPGEDVP